MERMDVSRVMTDDEMMELIQDVLEECAREYLLTVSERQMMAKEVFYGLRRLDILQDLVDDPQVTEIMVNGTSHIFYEKEGRIQEWEHHFTSEEKLSDVIQRIVGNSNRMVNELHPIVDTRLENGARVNIVLKPIAIDGTAVSIRRFPEHPITMSQLVEWQSISEEIMYFLENLVQAGYNIFVSGGTGSGKTTFLNALSEFIPEDERIVTIEDSAELQILGIPNLVRLETREVQVEGAKPISIRELIRSALRMRPSRIIVGECRGPEALDVLQAMNTGHSGSISTGHANSAADMLHRLETMVLMGMDLPISAIRGQIASGVDILIHLGRLRDKSRKLLSIVELNGMENGEICLHELYRFEEQEEQDGRIIGQWKKQGELLHQEKLRAAGL
ncbi:MAG: CpaF family protein [Roseburia sp.]